MLMKAGGHIMSAAEYEESLRRYQPTVYVDGDLIESVVDEPRLQPGIRAVGVTYDFAQRPEYGGLMLGRSGIVWKDRQSHASYQPSLRRFAVQTRSGAFDLS